MKWSQAMAEIFVPDGASDESAFRRTTHLGIGAHPDDLEFMASHAILECRQDPDKGFTGVTVTDGGGYAQMQETASLSAEQIATLRRKEQNHAAMIGEYAAMIHLAFTSEAVKQPGYRPLIDDLKQVFVQTSPQFVYTHNPADKHDTHVALTLAVIRAIRELPADQRPKAVYGCEVWRSLDWMLDKDKTVFDVSGHEDFLRSLMAVYASQIQGGKRYDLATLGRKQANATYHESHATDRATALEFAMDLTPLIREDALDIRPFVLDFVQRFAKDVSKRMDKFL